MTQHPGSNLQRYRIDWLAFCLPGLVLAIALSSAGQICAQGNNWRKPVGSGLQKSESTKAPLAGKFLTNPAREIAQPKTNLVKFKKPRQIPNQITPVPTGQPVLPDSDQTFSTLGAPLANQERQISEEPSLRRIVEGESEMLLPSPVRGNGGIEIIRQRYPDGKVQIERQVAQDNSGNYYNDGFWKLYNRQGQVLAEGQFAKGIMNGFWKRWHPADADGIFTTPPYNQFQGPFLSTATFSSGKLDGVWAMFDRNKRKVFEIPYQNGMRHGTASWFFPNSTRMREVTFYNNLIDGSLKEWNSQKKLVRHDEYIAGKKILRHTTYFKPQHKESENYYLEARLELRGKDDWWAARPADYEPVGERIQHGPAYAWHDNEQLKMKGRYDSGKRIGQFIWWHPNGQKQLVGEYTDEGLKSGTWTWWHPNGQKAIEGRYQDDIPVGNWTWWDDEGNVLSRKDMSTESLADPTVSEQNSSENPEVSREPFDRIPVDEVPDTQGAEALPPPLKAQEKPNSSNETSGKEDDLGFDELEGKTSSEAADPGSQNSDSKSSNPVEPPGGNTP